jgi:hypothetical protein
MRGQFRVPIDTGKPVLLPLDPEGTNMQPARMAEGRDEEEHLLLLVPDPDPALAEIDLQLLARSRLKPYRRPRFGTQSLSQMRHRPLHRAQAHYDILLRGELLAHDIGVARRAAGTASDLRRVTSASIADTSSGVRISILPDIPVGGRPASFTSFMGPPLSRRVAVPHAGSRSVCRVP